MNRKPIVRREAPVSATSGDTRYNATKATSSHKWRSCNAKWPIEPVAPPAGPASFRSKTKSPGSLVIRAQSIARHRHVIRHSCTNSKPRPRRVVICRLACPDPIPGGRPVLHYVPTNSPRILSDPRSQVPIISGGGRVSPLASTTHVPRAPRRPGRISLPVCQF